MDFLQTLNTLKEWKNLPEDYKDSKIDFIIAGALPEIIKHTLGQHIHTIIPEFPVPVSCLHQNIKNNKVCYIDFYISLKNGTNIFLELVPRENQANLERRQYLNKIPTLHMESILNKILEFNNDSKQNSEFHYLIENLISEKLLVRKNNKIECAILSNVIELFYITPSAKYQNEIGLDKISNIMSMSSDPIYQKLSELIIMWQNKINN